MEILLVEDNPGDTELIRIFLDGVDSQEPYEVTDVPRLQSAIDLMQRQHFDVAVLDLGLPDSNGIDTLERCIATAPEMPIVVLTGNQDAQLGLQAVKAGAQDFLSKGQISSQILSRVLRYAFERKQAEIRQHNTENKIQTILDALDIQVLLLNPDYRVEWPNRKVCDVFNMSRSQLIGKRCYEIWPEQKEYCQHCPVQKAIATSDHHTDYRHVKQGRTWDIKACPVCNSHGEIISVVELRTDITDRIELEEQFYQAQKMEAVGRLAGGVAHDFNNILSIIFGFADIAIQQVSTKEPLHECLEEIINAGRRAAGLVRQLLAFSRKETIDPQIVDCNELVTSSLKMLHRLVGEDVEVQFQPAPELWKVKIDPTQFEQIVINLVVNSRDAIRGTGLISIATQNRLIDKTHQFTNTFAKPGEYVELVVNDTGMGMSKEVLAKIFEPFFTTKKQGQGTGLGMSTIFGIVKQNNGMINVYSEERKGTSIKVYFPKNQEEEKDALKQDGPKSLVGNETVMVVEDDEAILRICRAMLAEYGYTVLIESDPLRAIETAQQRQEPIELLLTDTIMPNMNGRELQQAVVKLHPSVKTIFMSGYTADIISHQGILAEGIHFLQKPFTKNQLAEKIRTVLDV